MKIVVLGAGAVGGYFGGKLAKAGYPVTFLVREKRYNQLKESGLQVESIHGDFTIKPTLVKDVADIDHPDIVIVALKNYHLESALPTLGVLVEKGAKVLPLLNGIHHLDQLIETFGEDHVLGGLCYVESTLDEDGHVIQSSPMQDIIFGALSTVDSHFSHELEQAMTKAMINVTLSETILEDMWKKYIFLASLSGITAAVRQPIGATLNDDVTFTLLKDLITEVYQIAKARGIQLSENTVDQIVQKMKSLSPGMTSSMHRDLEKGLPMELDSLHGALLQMADEYNVQTPCIRAIYALLHPYRNGSLVSE